MTTFVKDYRPLPERRTVSPRWDRNVHDSILSRLVTEEKLTDRQIGKRLGFDPGTVRNHRCRLGLPVNPEPRKPIEWDDVARPLEERPDPRDLAALYLSGFDKETMTRHGRPIRVQDMVRQLNPILKALKLPQAGPREYHV